MKLDLRGGEGREPPPPPWGAAPNACKYSYQLRRSRSPCPGFPASPICGARTVPRSTASFEGADEVRPAVPRPAGSGTQGRHPAWMRFGIGILGLRRSGVWKRRGDSVLLRVSTAESLGTLFPLSDPFILPFFSSTLFRTTVVIIGWDLGDP